ncbi:MAG: calcium/sodium antiporter [Deltaproteobacteria bacterium]|nr:calcium/sodium antiporter [Deltaproteobacteria bacterium]
MAFLALTLGLAVLVAGGDLLISGAVKLAARLGMSSLLIGMTVVAFGTSMPELFVSLLASLHGHPQIMLGNIVGSNIANIGLVLALSAIIYPLSMNFKRLSRELYLLSGIYVVLLFVAYRGLFPKDLGIIFMGLLVGYTIYACWVESTRQPGSVKPEKSKLTPSLFYIIILCLGGLICMWLGSEYFIKGAVDLARFFGLSELVIGLTVAAVGTSLPELASSISAIRRRNSDILVGNILGSNLFNLLMVMGCTGAITPFKLPPETLSRDLPIMTAFTLILIPIAIAKKHTITRLHGLLLLAAYAGYIHLLT